MSRFSRHAVAANVVFNGETRHDNFAVVIEGRQIAALTPRADLASSITVYNAPRGAWLAPGFIDIQVNGGGDVLFNADPTPAALAKIAEAHRKFGVTSLLPTLITDRDEAMAAALDAVSVIMAREPGVLGFISRAPSCLQKNQAFIGANSSAGRKPIIAKCSALFTTASCS